MIDKLKLKILKFWKHKFKISLFIFISIALIFGIIIFRFIFFNQNILNIDFQCKSQLLASFGIILSSLIASFAVLTNIEVSKNKEEYQSLKYLNMQFLILNKYIEYSISWIEKFQSGYWQVIEDTDLKEIDVKLQEQIELSKKENLRLEEFINEIYNLRKEIFSLNNSFLYKREFTEDFNLAEIISNIEEIYHFKNAYGLDKDTYSDIKESLENLITHCMFSENSINKKLNLFEKDI